MGDFVVETSRFAEEKSAVFEFVIDTQSQSDLFLVISDSIRSGKFYVFTMTMMLTHTFSLFRLYTTTLNR